MKQIPLTQNLFTIVDDCDYLVLSKYTWHTMKNPKHIYAGRKTPMVRGKRKIIYMHRQILCLREGDSTKVDHRDGNGLNNRRHNLRCCTHGENMQNRKTQTHSSKYKGVSWNKKNRRWVSGIKFERESIHLGSYTNEKEAAKAYDKKAIELFGSFANTNL